MTSAISKCSNIEKRRQLRWGKDCSKSVLAGLNMYFQLLYSYCPISHPNRIFGGRPSDRLKGSAYSTFVAKAL